MTFKKIAKALEGIIYIIDCFLLIVIFGITIHGRCTFSTEVGDYAFLYCIGIMLIVLMEVYLMANLFRGIHILRTLSKPAPEYKKPYLILDVAGILITLFAILFSFSEFNLINWGTFAIIWLLNLIDAVLSLISIIKNKDFKFKPCEKWCLIKVIGQPLIICSVLVVAMNISTIISSNLSNQKLFTNAKGDMSSFEMEDFEGNEYTEEIFKDHTITVINVWGTFCSPCIKEMPELQALSEEFDPSEIYLMGMVGDVRDTSGSLNEENIEKARTIIEQTGVKYPNLIPSEEIQNGIIENLGGAFPATIIFNSEGELIEKVMGARSQEEWREIFNEVLENEK